MPEAGDSSSTWWDADIIEDRAPAPPGGGAAGAYAAPGQWERFTVRWVAEESASQRVSPWELFAPGGDAAAEEPARVAPADAKRALSAVSLLAKRHRAFAETPAPGQAFEGEDGAWRPYNREVALPLGLDVLQARAGAAAALGEVAVRRARRGLPWGGRPLRGSRPDIAPLPGRRRSASGADATIGASRA